jgi:ABC-type sugar transport system substrate-binding protein
MTLSMLSRCALLLTLLCALLACGSAAPGRTDPSVAPQPGTTIKTYENLVVGFAQIGAESEWRTANTRSLQETAGRLGIELKLADAQQQQEMQIQAIRSFIAQRVDVIGISPVVETGWDEVFAEVEEAGIPLILLDRHADVPDTLVDAFIGSDFIQEGRSACEELVKILGNEGNIVILEGTDGSAPTIDRRIGFDECLQNYPAIHVLDREAGDFIRAKGKEEMEQFLVRYGSNIDALFAQNDDMALGAIEAIEAYGLKPGDDIKIVSVDAVRAAFDAMIAGKLNVTIECNPLLGPLFFETALRLANDQPVDKWVKSETHIYRQDTALQELPNRQY